MKKIIMKNKAILSVIVLVAVFYALTTFATAVPLSSQKWDILAYHNPSSAYSIPWFYIKATQDLSGSLVFQWPAVGTNDSVNRIQTHSKAYNSQNPGKKVNIVSLTGASFFNISFKIDGPEGTTFEKVPEAGNTCATLPHVYPYIESTKIGINDPAARWWSGAAKQVLAVGQDVNYNVSLDPTLWTNVNGKRASDNLTLWNQMKSFPVIVGLSVGAGCFYGHGVIITSGSAQFTLRAFQVN